MSETHSSNNDQEKDQLRFERKMETIFAISEFRRLAAYVEEVCLSSPLPPVEHASTSENPEAQLVQKLGLHGLRSAYDLVYGGEWHLDFSGRENNTDEEPLINTDSSILYPTSFSEARDPEVASWAERFGEALLNEMYLVLGPDVHEKIEEYKNATTATEQISIVAWLDERLHTITKDQIGLEKSEELSYHPVRLSPKFISQYPEITIAPSCLGVSIIAASFFHAVKAEHLHAGVMFTRYHRQMDQAVELFKGLFEKMNELDDIELTDDEKCKIRKLIQDVSDKISKDEGYHAANYVKLVNGLWMQVDPNFDVTACLDSEASQQINVAYEQITRLQRITPGIELTVQNMYGALSTLVLYALTKTTRTNFVPICDVEIFLDESSSEAFYEKIKRFCIAPFFNIPGMDDDIILKAIQDIRYVGGDNIFDSTAQDTIDKFILNGMSIDEMYNRCRTDNEFRRRKIEDIRRLPVNVCVALAVQDISDGRDMDVHDMVEVGMPAQRIAMSVLSDFAGYDTNNLPPSFWFSHWASFVPVTEVHHGGAISHSQKDIVLNHSHLNKIKRLSYAKSDAIVKKFLLSVEEGPAHEGGSEEAG